MSNSSPIGCANRSDRRSVSARKDRLPVNVDSVSTSSAAVGLSGARGDLIGEPLRGDRMGDERPAFLEIALNDGDAGARAGAVRVYEAPKCFSRVAKPSETNRGEAASSSRIYKSNH